MRLSFPSLMVLLMILVNGAVGQEDRYPNPPTPKPVDPNAPSFLPLDIQVDAFVRIPQARSQFQVDGKGLAVVVIDTGINAQHDSFRERLIPGKNFTSEGGPDDTTDHHGHGSNCAGIIMGREMDGENSVPTGVAPQAKVISLKVFPGGEFTSINSALEWVIAKRDGIRTTHGVTISVVNMSLGNGVNLQTVDPNTLPQALKRQHELIVQLRGLNIAVTVAAGNAYKSFAPAEGMGFPGICKETVSVGAVYDTSFPRRFDGQPLITYVDNAKVFEAVPERLTVFSQRLGSARGNEFRTDIFAPGFIVTAAGPVPQAGSTENPARTRSTDDGTSQASPVVAGTILLLQHRYQNLMRSIGREPGLPPVTLIESCLRTGGKPITDVEDMVAQQMDNVQSCGAVDLFRVDAVGALEDLSNRFQADLRNLQLNLFTQPTTASQAKVLDEATILQTKVKK
ncbi:MAG: S8 family serine peptidase [Planctomycetota bacterium]